MATKLTRNRGGGQTWRGIKGLREASAAPMKDSKVADYRPYLDKYPDGIAHTAAARQTSNRNNRSAAAGPENLQSRCPQAPPQGRSSPPLDGAVEVCSLRDPDPRRDNVATRLRGGGDEHGCYAV
jgi:hypothetical protein